MVINENKRIEMKIKFAEDRRYEIFRHISQKQRVTVDELALRFKVSGVTIRRDLGFLKRQNLIYRTHGGAISQNGNIFEYDYSEQTKRFQEEKKRIAKEASKLVREGEVIFLEASTTVLQLARIIRNKTNLTVVTNCLDIAGELRGSIGINVILTGGTLKRKTQALIGPLTEMCLNQFRLDKAFVGINALDIDYGLTMPTLEEAQTRKEIHKAANKVIVLSDSSKFGEQSFAYIAPVSSIDVLVTDRNMPRKMKRQMEKMGIEVRMA
jgi:DeoR family fructose operon transcriptional repressor